MPLFKKSEPAPPPVTSTNTSTSSSQRRSLFSGHRNSTETDATSTTSAGTHRSGFFSRNKEDPSVAAARQRVASAEAAERDADQARLQASRAVRDAKDHVKRVEAEAAEDARLAKAKQQDAKSLGKRANPLGRHGVAH